MNLTKTERLLLSNQFRILHHLTENEYYSTNAEIVENGYAGLYDELFSPIFEEKPEAIYTETQLILHMYRVINNAYVRLSPEEQAQIAMDAIAFEGFDGNNDPHSGLITFLVEKKDLWDEYKDKYLNSHSSLSIRKYRRMLEVYDKLGGDSHNHYTVGELLQFQAAL